MTVPLGGLACVDVAGLPAGRAAVLASGPGPKTLEILERTRPFAPVRRVRSIPVAPAAVAAASFRDGRVAILDASEVVLLSAELEELDRVPLPSSPGLAPRDVAVDRSGRLFVLLADLATPDSQLFHAIPVGSATSWQPIPVTLVGGSAIGAIDTPAEPPPLAEAPPIPYAPPPPPAPSTGAILRPVAGDDGLWVFASAGFSGSRANPGRVSLLGFLELEASATATVDVGASRLSCTGAGCLLRLRYDTGAPTYLYGTPVAGIPVRFTTNTPAGIPLLSGSFHVDLATGALVPDAGQPFALDLLDLAPIGVVEANVLGMGSRYSTVSRTGIGVRGSFRAVPKLGGQDLCFGDLLLGDFGGTLRASFGQSGLPGAGLPFDQGTLFLGDGSCSALPFPGTSVAMPRMVVRGGINLADQASNLFFDEATISSSRGCSTPICETRFDLQVSGLEIGSFVEGGATANGIRFGEGGANVAGLVIVRVAGGKLVGSSSPGGPDPGLHAAEAVIEFPFGDDGLEVTGLYAGSSGLRFEKAPGFEINDFSFDFQGVNLDFERKVFDAGYARISRSSAASPKDNFEGQFDNLHLPFSFFEAPPKDVPLATAGFVRLGDEADPPFSMCWGVFDPSSPFQQPPAPEYACPTTSFPFRIGRSEVSVPGFFLRSKSPKFTALFPGARITKEFVEIGDLPPIAMFGSTVDLGVSRVSRHGFFTESAVYSRNQIEVGLEDFRIAYDPLKPLETDLSITGGHFKKGGVGFSFSEFVAKKSDLDSNPSTPDVIVGGSFDFETFGFPVLRRVEGSAEIWYPNHFDLSIKKIKEVNLGPLRLRDISFQKQKPAARLASRFFTPAELAVPSSVDDASFYFSGGMGWGRFPDVFGELEVERGRLKLLSLRGVFQPPGYALGTSPIFLQEVGASLHPYAQELLADVVLTAGPEVGYPPFIGPSRLVTVRGDARLSAVGYLHSRARVSMFENPGFGGFPVGDGEFILGKVFVGDRFVGTGVYFAGRVVLFYGVLNAGVSGWMFEEGGGQYGASINGSMQVPSSVPVIGGLSFGSVGATLSGRVNPPTGAISGNVRVTLFCVPYVGCTRIDVGFRIDSSGFSVSRAPAGSPASLEFDKGYHRAGIATLTNYRRLSGPGGTARAAGSRAVQGAPLEFDVPAGVRDAIVRIDTTLVPGTAGLRLQFPDGQTRDAANTPTMAAAASTTLVAGDLPIFYREASVPASGTETGLKEAAFLFRGPLAWERVQVLDPAGNPTGEVRDVLTSTDIPVGRYVVTVVPNGDVTGAPVDFLVGNRRPKLDRATLEPLGADRYRLDFTVSDPDGDSVTVRAHLGTDPVKPAFSYPVAPAAGLAGPAGQFVVDVAALAGQAISGPIQVFLSLDDDRGPASFERVSVVAPAASPLAPSRVQGVVARADADSVRLFWDPVLPPSAPGSTPVSYTAIVTETGPAGSTGAPRTVSVPIPAPGGTEPSLTEAFLPGLTPGRVYRAVVVAMAKQVVAGAGAPLCPCGVTSLPGDTCHPASSRRRPRAEPRRTSFSSTRACRRPRSSSSSSAGASTTCPAS